MIDIGVDKPGHSLRTLVYQALKNYDTPALLPLLCDKDSIVSTAAARELQHRGGHLVFEEAIRLTGSRQAREREISAFLLGQLGTPKRPFAAKSVPLLVTLLREDRAVGVRATAAASLGHLAATSALRALVDASEDANVDVRAAVAFALSRFPRNADARDCLQRLSRDVSDEVRRWAAMC